MSDEINGAELKKRGRKPGSPKVPGSGRRKGSPNRDTRQTRERIAKEADPVGYFVQLATGKRQSAAGEPGAGKRTWVYPTLQERNHAQEVLLHKLMPNMRAVELTGEDGKPIETRAAGSDALEELMSRLKGMSQRVNFDDRLPTEMSHTEKVAQGDIAADSKGANN